MDGWRSHLDAPYDEDDTAPTPAGMDSSSCHDSAFPFEESSADTSADQELDIFSKKTSPFAALQPSSCIVAVVVIIVALIAASLILPRVKAPRELVASYVRAVANGDFEHATQLANPNVPQSARALFAHGVLDANHRITSYDIDFKHESFSPLRYSVHMFYTLGNKQGEQYRGSSILRLHMKPNGSWAFDDSLLNVMKLPRSERFTVNGVPVSDTGFNLNSICPTSKKYCKSKLMLDIDDDDFYVPAYPGIYAVSTPLPADNPKLFTVVQRDIFIPYGSSNTRVPETSGTDGDNTAGSADSSGNTDGSDATSTDDTESDRYRYGETRSDDGTWVAVVNASLPYSFSIDYDFTDQAKTSMLRQLDVHTRSCVSKLNARDLSDNTCTFISKYLDPQVYSAWTVAYTPGKLSSDSLSIGQCKPQNNGTIACNIYDFVGGKLTLNLTTSGGNSDHFQYGSWHSFDDTMVVDKDCVAPVFATH